MQSHCPDTDFVAKLIDLYRDGRAMLVMDGVIRPMYRDPSGAVRHLIPPGRGHIELPVVALTHGR